MRYVPGYKGPTLPGPKQNPNDPRLASPKPRLPMPKPKPTIPSQAIDPVRPSTPVGTKPRGPAPTGPMVPVRGGGMAPQSLAYIMKKAPMMKKGGSVSSASSRADGCATKGKTKGKII